MGMGRISLGGGQRRGDGPVISRSARRGGRVFIEYLLSFFLRWGDIGALEGRVQDYRITELHLHWMKDEVFFTARYEWILYDCDTRPTGIYPSTANIPTEYSTYTGLH